MFDSDETEDEQAEDPYMATVKSSYIPLVEAVFKARNLANKYHSRSPSSATLAQFLEFCEAYHDARIAVRKAKQLDRDYGIGIVEEKRLEQWLEYAGTIKGSFLNNEIDVVVPRGNKEIFPRRGRCL